MLSKKSIGFLKIHADESIIFIFGIPKKWDTGPIHGTRNPGPSIWDLGPGTQDSYIEPRTRDLSAKHRTWNPRPLPGTLYLGPYM